MSKYSYFSVHDLKDLAMIYNDCDDYKVKVWDPALQKEGTIYFTGSSNVDKEINFNIKYEEDSNKNVFEAFNDILGQIIDSGYDMSIDWNHKFLEKVIQLRK